MYFVFQYNRPTLTLIYRRSSLVILDSKQIH